MGNLLSEISLCGGFNLVQTSEGYKLLLLCVGLVILDWSEDFATTFYEMFRHATGR